MKTKLICLYYFLFLSLSGISAQSFRLDSSGYFRNKGIDVMAFNDFYPEGHQGGICLIMNGNRLATNGDIRLEATPGQWQPVPKQLNRLVDYQQGRISTTLCYPDSSRHLTGFNPMIYPDLQLTYTIHTESLGDSILITVDLDQPVPEEYIGKAGFNLELFPGNLFGKPWIMDNQSGIFPRQPNGPVYSNQSANSALLAVDSIYPKADLAHLADVSTYNPIHANDFIAEPYASGYQLTISPDDALNKYTIYSKEVPMQLYDGRMNHNNGWFVVRSEIPANKTKQALQWVLVPTIIDDWTYAPVIQVSQVGYQPAQPKKAIIELDKENESVLPVEVFQITANGKQAVYQGKPERWGSFLRYNYLTFDFTPVVEEGLYEIRYGDQTSTIFRIASDVYERGVWQPVLEYFLPVQMCHMRVNEKYRIWHDLCHQDDATMAPVMNHIDGYVQQADTYGNYQAGEQVPDLHAGGWHDAGDFDLRIESQAGEIQILSHIYENFNTDYDATTIDQQNKCVEIHQPDGKADILQQIEHGTLSIVNGYQALGRLYRGIISNQLRQYVLLGDPAAMTNNITGDADDRWVFTENNPSRELSTAAALAAASRTLQGFNDSLSNQALDIAGIIYQQTPVTPATALPRLQAATELYLTTQNPEYKNYILDNQDLIIRQINRCGWYISRIEKMLDNPAFSEAFRNALTVYKADLDQLTAETPYGIPYKPSIWGAGWDIQRFGYQHYFLTKAYPDIFDADVVYNALNFILGCHPGSNTNSFASGIGTQSATIAYGTNRADWSYTPGGVISGTAIIRPDFPELLDFPFLWQQAEYVMGGGSTHFMFLVLAANDLLQNQ